VSGLAASSAVSFLGHNVESARAKIGGQARRLVQGVVGQEWRTLHLSICYEHRRNRGV